MPHSLPLRDAPLCLTIVMLTTPIFSNNTYGFLFAGTPQCSGIDTAF